ncbi:hypothetical protein pb186bvf_013040 [Paramecium bursaria]
MEEARQLILNLKQKQTLQLIKEQVKFIDDTPKQLPNQALKLEFNPSYQFNDLPQIDKQKQISKYFVQLTEELDQLKQTFANSLENNCPVVSFIGLQGLGIYFSKESELLKLVQNKRFEEVQQDSEEFDKLIDLSRQLQLNTILLYIQQKLANEKIKYIKENMLTDDVLIYDYGNLSKINQINKKLQIDGPLINEQLKEKWENIKKLCLQKAQIQIRQKNQQLYLLKDNLLSQQKEILQIISSIKYRMSQIKNMLVQENQIILHTQDKVKQMNFSYIYNTINENKSIIEFEKVQSKSIYVEPDSREGQIYMDITKKQGIILWKDLLQIFEQILKHNKSIRVSDDLNNLNIIHQCFKAIMQNQHIEINDIGLRSRFNNIQRSFQL